MTSKFSTTLQSKLVSPRVRVLGVGIVLGLGGAGIGMHAVAAGIPSADVLTYTGYLETPQGMPVTTKVNLRVAVYNAVEAGQKLCENALADVSLVSGRFSMPLPDCVAQVKANPDLWVETSVNDAPLGRTKLGAVPYALEAGHATSADAVGSLPASSINNGVLHTDAFSAYADLQA